VIVAVDPTFDAIATASKYGHRPAPQRERQLQRERQTPAQAGPAPQTDRIVHQEGGEDAGGRDDRA